MNDDRGKKRGSWGGKPGGGWGKGPRPGGPRGAGGWGKGPGGDRGKGFGGGWSKGPEGGKGFGGGWKKGPGAGGKSFGGGWNKGPEGGKGFGGGWKRGPGAGGKSFGGGWNKGPEGGKGFGGGWKKGPGGGGKSFGGGWNKGPEGNKGFGGGWKSRDDRKPRFGGERAPGGPPPWKRPFDGPRRDKPFAPPPQKDFQEAPPAAAAPEAASADESSFGDIVFGRHPVLELLRAEGDCRVNKLWLLKGAQGGPFDEVVRLAQDRRVVFQWVERDRLDLMVRAANHQGVVARVADVGYGSLDDLLKEGTPSPVVLLDGIEDPQNLGAIVRSAAFFGAKGVMIPRWRSAGLSGAVMKASAGALAKVPLIQVTNIAQTLLELKEKGYWIYGADGAGEPVSAMTMNEPLALVIGAEGEGLHRLVKERCDGLASVPGSGDMESLNASCAAAVLLHEIFRRKKPAP